jgi:hypothetical protein
MKIASKFYKNENKEFTMKKRRNIRMLIGKAEGSERKKVKKTLFASVK